jgi:hypothetical protein
VCASLTALRSSPKQPESKPSSTPRRPEFKRVGPASGGTHETSRVKECRAGCDPTVVVCEQLSWAQNGPEVAGALKSHLATSASRVRTTGPLIGGDWVLPMKSPRGI